MQPRPGFPWTGEGFRGGEFHPRRGVYWSGLRGQSQSTAVGAEAGAEGGEPPVLRSGRPVGVQRLLQCKQDGRAAHIAVAAKGFAGGGEVVSRKFCRDGVDHILAARVRNDATDRVRVRGLDRALVEVGDCLGGEGGDRRFEQVAEFAVTVFKPNFIPIGGIVKRIEIEAAELSGLGRSFPNGGGGPVAEEARADEHAEVVIEVEGGGANFDGYTGYGCLRVPGENTINRAERGNGGAATESDKILQVGIVAQPQLFGQVAGHPGTEVAGAGAHHESIEIVRGDAGLRQGRAQRGGGEDRGGAAKLGVELICIHIKDTTEIGHRELARRDPGVAVEDGAEGQLTAAVEGGASRIGTQHRGPTLGLGEGLRRIRRGDALKIHEGG